MAEDGSWPLIAQLGLLSTEALVDAFEIEPERRTQLLAAHRPARVTICSDRYGEAVIRDQIPLRESLLARVLQDDLIPADWYRMLNSFTFFWPTEQRLRTLLAAQAYRDRVHTVLTVDTERLLDLHGERVRLSPINSGSTLFNPRPRGQATFRTVEAYPYREMRQHRGPAGAIAEVAVLGGVEPIEPILVRVERRQRDATLEQLWPR